MSRDIPLGQIRPDPDQPRQHFRDEKIEELAQSLKENGQAVPIAVRPEPDGPDGFVIIHGERRWRAAKRLGWKTIAADVQKVSAETARWRSLTENVQREDLSPIEEALAYRRQLGRHDMTQGELGEQVGKSQSYISQKLRLLRLPPPVSFWLKRGALSEGHARQLMTIEGTYLDGATRPVSGNPEYVEGQPWEAVQSAINILRPLDWPPFLYNPGSDKKRDVVRTALRRLCTFDRGKEPAPAWTVAAWFYGLVAYCEDLSVSELSDVVGTFTDRIESHVGFFFPNPPWHEAAPEKPNVALDKDEDGTPVEELPLSALRRVEEANVYFGALSDLRHAGLLPALQATWRHVDPESAAEQAPDFSAASEADLSEDELDANAERLWECSGVVAREERYLWPSKMDAPGTREHREGKAARQYRKTLEETAV